MISSSHERPDVASFYHLRDASLGTCSGTACFVARFLNPERWRDALGRESRVYRLGKCYASPSAAEGRQRPSIHAVAARPVVLERLVEGSVRTLTDYRARGGYRALESALGRGPAAIVDEVERSGLRGRGGAGFPTGRKLRAVASESAPTKYVVMNADEGDSGAYIDRILLEDDPHALLEGLALAAYAVGATKGYVYLRREYPDALPILEAAIGEARSAGIFGPKMLGCGPAFDVEVVVGLGSYVLRRGDGAPQLHRGPPSVRAQPAALSEREGAPRAADARPERGDARESALDHPPRRCRVRGDGVLAQPRDEGPSTRSSGGRASTRWSSGSRSAGSSRISAAGLPPAPSGVCSSAVRSRACCRPRHFDAPLAFEELAALGASVDHGGVVAFDEHTSIRELVHHVFSFGAYESCGRCTPCRLGARSVEDMITPGRPAWDAMRFEEIVSALRATSLCGHGTGLGEFAQSLLRHYPEELAACCASS
jgi:NADH:ubiquinone oxidoreductase subunit F (NADH-binding)